MGTEPIADRTRDPGRGRPGREYVCGLIGLALMLFLPGCSPAKDPAEAAGRRTGSPLSRGEFERALLLSGELQAVRSIAIKSPETNTFQMRIQFMAEEGAFIKKGEDLLDFDNSALAEQVRDLESRILDAETQIVSKRNQLASSLKDLEIQVAEREYEHQRTKLEASVDREVLSRKEHAERTLAATKATEELAEVHERIELTRDRGTAELDVLMINRDKLIKDLQSAQQGVDLLSIKAPEDGLVVYERRQNSTLRFQEGDSCWPGQGVIRLPDLSEMQVVFGVNEVDAPLLEVGMPVRVSLDAFPGRELDGEIRKIPSMAVKRDESSKVAIFKVVASLSETWVGEMKPGMSALGRVVFDRRSNVPLVARNAVRFDGEQYWYDPPEGDEAAPLLIAPVDRNDWYYALPEDDFANIGGEPRDTAAAPVDPGGQS